MKDSLRKVLFHVGSIILGLYVLAMLVSAVLLVITPEITSGWARAFYIIIPSLFLLLIVAMFFIWNIFSSDIAFKAFVPFMILVPYISVAFPEWLVPLYASFHVWSGISVYGLFGSNAIVIISLCFFAACLVWKLFADFLNYKQIAYPLVGFACSVAFFLVFLPWTQVYGGIAISFFEFRNFPMPMIFFPAMVIYIVVKRVGLLVPNRNPFLYIISYVGMALLTLPLLYLSSLFVSFLIWNWDLATRHPWTIVITLVVLYLIKEAVHGRFFLSSSSTSAPSSASEQKRGSSDDRYLQERHIRERFGSNPAPWNKPNPWETNFRL